MMADLFGIGGTPVDPTLEGFSKNGVERLFHAEVKHRVGDAEDNCFNQFVDGSLLLQSFKNKRGVCHAENESLQIAFGAEDIDWPANVKH